MNIKCRICNSTELRIFHNEVWNNKNAKVYECKKCNFIFISPYMSEVEENNFYANYNNHCKKRGVILSSSSVELHIKSLLTAKKRFKIIRNYYKDCYKSVIEIGSSTGAFLSLLNNNKKYAVERNRENREYSSKFCNAVFENIEDYDREKIDIVCMFHVFEHIRNPINLLAACKKILKQNGVIIIEVPNINDPLISIYNLHEFKNFYFQPMHQYVYSEKTLDYLFLKLGFKKEKVLYYQRYGLDNHLSWLKNKKSGGDKNITKLFGRNSVYCKRLQDAELTDTIFYIARKD